MDYISKTTHDGRNVRVKNYKKRVRRNRIKRRILFFSFLLLCILLFLYLAPIFKIKEIRCSTGEFVSKEEIISASTISYDFNLFRTSLKKAKKGIEEIPYVKNATVKRKIPNIIEIDVTECTVFGYIPLNEGYIYIDEECKTLDYSATAPENLPIIQNTGAISYEAGKKLLPDDEKKLDVLKAFFQTVQSNGILSEISIIDIAQADKLTIFYKNSLEIYIGDIEKIDYKINFAVRTILDQLGENPKGYLDVSNPDYGSVYREKK